MFGNMLYFDDKKVNDYRAIAKGEKSIKIGKVDIASDKGANINLPIGGGNIKASKNYEATIEESILFDCQEFERQLEGRDDYFDFTTSADFDFSSLVRGYIVKFDSMIRVPEEFDLTQTIAQFRPYLISSISKDMDSDEGTAFKTFFESANPRIPLILECDDMQLCSKIDSRYLMVDYPQLEEYENLEVTVLARIISNNSISSAKAIFDPLKDFISLNRAMRRSFATNRPDGLKEIFSPEDYRNIEILAVYQ